MRSNKMNCKFSAASIRADILVPYRNINEQHEFVLRKNCFHYIAYIAYSLSLQAQPEIKHKDATGELVCSALTSHYHYCVVCFVLCFVVCTVTLTQPLGLKLLLTSIAPKIQTSSERSYQKCLRFPHVKAIVSR